MSKIKTQLILILLLTAFGAYAQSLSDIQNVKVDDLSDAQIEQLIRRAESSGMNEQQLEAMARERGMPAGEIAKLRQRIQSLRTGGRDGQQGTMRRGAGLRQAPDSINQEEVFDSLRKSDPYYDLTPTQKSIFGYTLFHNRELDFSPNLNIPTPENYVVGSGDQLLIDVYGASQQSYELTVNAEGRVFIPNVGPIAVGGSNIGAATSRIRNALSNIYSGLTGGNPNTFLQIRLGNIRSIQIAMVGEVRKPGNYTLPSFATVFNALFAAGGPNENGSFRHVQVYRENKLVTEVDVYEFLVEGNQGANIRLNDNDVVIVQPVRSRVELTGEIRRPGLFETKEGDNIEDLIRYGGGYTSNAYRDRINVRRTTDSQMKVEDVSTEDYTNFSIKDGDFFKVGELLNRYENRVQVSGAVFRPGEFALAEGMTIRSLVQKAEGLRGDAFQGRATLYRTKPNFTMEVLAVDIQGIMEGTVPDIALQREDILNIASVYDVKEEYYVQISGEVNRTGIYQFGENMTVGDLIVKAKGFKESATNSSIEIARRVKDDPSGKIANIIRLDVDANLELNESEKNITLSPFDHVFVRRSPGFQRERVVKVEGEVFYPGEYALEKNDERISDVLRRAGGLNQFSYARGATLIRRTEFYKTLEEEEMKLKNLESLLDHIDRDEAIENSEAELELLERLEKRVELLREEKIKREMIADDEESASSFATDRYVSLDGADTSAMSIALKETELIGIELERIMENPGSKYDLILKEGDVLSIPKELQTVRMRGEVLYPTTARYDINRGFRNYISRAGGFTESARKGRSYVIYANGDVKRTNKFLFITFFPKIEPGAEIFVPQKPDRQPMSVQAWIGMASSLATLAILVDRLAN